jgi:hypothetical protein
MMPYNSYRLYQIERAKSPAEVRRADEQAGRLASAASSLFRGITPPVRAIDRSSPAATRRLAPSDLTGPPSTSSFTRTSPSPARTTTGSTGADRLNES